MAAKELTMVTAAVPDVVGTADAWMSATDYRKVAEYDVDAVQRSLWGVEANSHPRAVVLAARGYERGLLRLVETDRPAEVSPRVDWLGPLGIEFFSPDVDTVFKRMTAQPRFIPITPPTDFDLTYLGAGLVRTFGVRGPGNLGVFISTFRGGLPADVLPVVDRFVSPAVNVPTMAVERAPVEAFYREMFGIPIRFDGIVKDADINRLMGADPDWEFRMVTFWVAHWQMAEHHLHPPGRLARPPIAKGRLRSGVAGFSLTVDDLDVVLKLAREKGLEPRGPIELHTPPHDGRRSACLQGPNGELVELLEA